MLEEQIRETIREEYSLEAEAIEKIKNVYKITTQKDKYCLKVIKYELNHFLFIISAIKHLQNNHFQKTPDIIKNNCSRDYIALGNKYAYLTPWVQARECNYNNPFDVMLAACKLAELHKKSFGFDVTEEMKPRIGWHKWVNNFKNKKNEILMFKNIIENKENKTEFDSYYLKSINEELIRVDKSIQDLIKSDYFNKMACEVQNKGFCHHDYANHNVLIEENGNVDIIDFDYCILDTHLHDLCSLIIRVMKNGKWDVNNSIKIIDYYSSIYPIERFDIPIMASFIEFPQAFWQLGIQYYMEKQPWGEEFFINKLNKIYEDKDLRQEFVDEFKNKKYN
ncbi:CotS family spore coat protein [Clostridium lundense]|uniref:CotS family spore coat protein n=1 Tax=Clostridium lundense TaxID=319475 RepID=UPI0004807F54|nr:CotS family spore coat protein [Clostridium lundense]